jgi:hypothetical protein
MMHLESKQPKTFDSLLKSCFSGKNMEKPKAPRIPFLLRKSRGGQTLQVLRQDDFPFAFTVEGRAYEVRRTKAGGVIMVKTE